MLLKFLSRDKIRVQTYAGHKLNYIKEEIMKKLALKEHVKIRKAKRNFYVHLPVVTIRG